MICSTSGKTGVGEMLEVENLSIVLDTENGPGPIIQDVGFSIGPGEIFGLTRKSGAGKTMTARAVSGLLEKPARISNGRIRLCGKDMRPYDPDAWRGRMGKDVFMMFQDAASALNPMLPVGKQIEDVLLEVKGLPRKKTQRSTEAFFPCAS